MSENPPKLTYMQDSISETNGLSLISQQDQNIYSVGISTAGFVEIRMAKELPNRQIIATTIDSEGANFARELIAKEQLSDKIEVKIEDVSQPLPYEDGFFDFIYARLVLHYLPKNDLKNALQELYRVLKKNGKIFVVVRSKDCLVAQGALCDPETGMTTYVSEDGRSCSSHFHNHDSIYNFLSAAGFQITQIKAYDEQLCIDFQRTKPSKQVDNLIEVYALKPY